MLCTSHSACLCVLQIHKQLGCKAPIKRVLYSYFLGKLQRNRFRARHEHLLLLRFKATPLKKLATPLRPRSSSALPATSLPSSLPSTPTTWPSPCVFAENFPKQNPVTSPKTLLEAFETRYVGIHLVQNVFMAQLLHPPPCGKTTSMDNLYDHLHTSPASLDCRPAENVMISTFLAYMPSDSLRMRVANDMTTLSPCKPLTNSPSAITQPALARLPSAQPPDPASQDPRPSW
jgi:hypothetical protein